MDTKILIDVIKDSGCQARAYSGRGMNGKQCLGCVVEGNPLRALADIVFADDVYDAEAGYDLLSKAKMDSMGLDKIVYWPHIAWPDGSSAIAAATGSALAPEA